MEAICSSETSVDIQHTTRLYIPEDRTLYNHCYENLKSYIVKLEINFSSGMGHNGPTLIGDGGSSSHSSGSNSSSFFYYPSNSVILLRRLSYWKNN
jgi:hypothetical protein